MIFLHTKVVEAAISPTFTPSPLMFITPLPHHCSSITECCDLHARGQCSGVTSLTARRGHKDSPEKGHTCRTRWMERQGIAFLHLDKTNILNSRSTTCSVLETMKLSCHDTSSRSEVTTKRIQNLETVMSCVLETHHPQLRPIFFWRVCWVKGPFKPTHKKNCGTKQSDQKSDRSKTPSLYNEISCDNIQPSTIYLVSLPPWNGIEKGFTKDLLKKKKISRKVY